MIIFDYGHTLLYECNHNAENGNKAAYEYIKDNPDNVSYELFNKTCLELYAKIKANRGNIEIHEHHFLKMLEYEVLYKDAEECLKNLSSKYKIGVIANQSLGTADRLEQFGILKYIDLVVASAEEGVAKPNKEIFEIALNRAGCKPEHAIMIGDRIDNDIVPAKKLGMKTIWVKQGFGKYWNITSEEEKSDYAVANLTEISDILI